MVLCLEWLWYQLYLLWPAEWHLFDIWCQKYRHLSKESSECNWRLLSCHLCCSCVAWPKWWSKVMLLTFCYQILLTPYQRKIHVILTNQQQFSTVCLVIDHRNDVNVQNPSETEWFHCNVLNIFVSFLWSIRVQTMENCCRFVFWNNEMIGSFIWCPFQCKFLGKSCTLEREKQITPPSHYFHGLYSYQT